MHKTRVAVLRGGPSSEYEVSLKSGATALKHIPNFYETQDILISKDGTWHKAGVPTAPHTILTHTDVVFNALHGHYGEDGKLQHMLEVHGIPFTGSGSFASALAINKVLAKEVFVQEGIKTPQCVVFEELAPENLGEVFRAFAPPYIVKPAVGDSVVIVKTRETLLDALTQAFTEGHMVLVEEYIPGVEATVSVIDGYRDHELYVLPPIEIRGGEGTVPGNFSEKDKRELEDLAKKVHKALGFNHYSHSNFIVTPRRGIFVLEANSLPHLTEDSLLSKALHSVGASLSHFFDHLLQRALTRGKK